MSNNNAVAPTTDEGTICLYPSRPCTNTRAVKLNGQLHQFCEKHRQKANYSQRRLEHKHQLQQELARLKQSSTPERIPAPLADAALRDEGEFDLSDDDIKLLLEMVSAYNKEM